MQAANDKLRKIEAENKKLIEKNGVLLTKGTISLQSESHPVQFRKIEILDLSK